MNDNNLKFEEGLVTFLFTGGVPFVVGVLHGHLQQGLDVADKSVHRVHLARVTATTATAHRQLRPRPCPPSELGNPGIDNGEGAVTPEPGLLPFNSLLLLSTLATSTHVLPGLLGRNLVLQVGADLLDAAAAVVGVLRDG